MTVTRVQYPRRKTTRQQMREDTKAGKRESSDSIPGRGKDATRAAVDKRRTARRNTRMADPAPIKPSSMPKPKPAGNVRMVNNEVIVDESPLMGMGMGMETGKPTKSGKSKMKAGGKVNKDRRDGIAQRGLTRA